MSRHSARALEEASAWLVLLRGPRRTRELEEGFRRWKAKDRAHCRAFEAVTSMWEMTERLPRPPLPLPRRWQRAGFRAGMYRAVGAVAATVLVIVAAALWYRHEAGVATAVGEQRVLTLKDGTRVHLNTDTRLVVRYSGERRSIELKKGEALFEVAPHGARWPFVVMAGNRQVTALGTSFIVKREAHRLSVTLVEGKVNVAPVDERSTVASIESRTMIAGERLVIEDGGEPRLDRPKMEQVASWRRGRVELNDTPLAQAVHEMNRYTELKIVVEQPRTAAILVKGAFRAGDTMSFAQSVATTCKLELVQKRDEIVLKGLPAANCR